MLNFLKSREARLEYLPGRYRVIVEGDYVTCAVTGRRIPLKDLKFWSHELQEAYATPEAAVERYVEARKEGRLG